MKRADLAGGSGRPPPIRLDRSPWRGKDAVISTARGGGARESRVVRPTTTLDQSHGTRPTRPRPVSRRRHVRVFRRELFGKKFFFFRTKDPARHFGGNKRDIISTGSTTCSTRVNRRHGRVVYIPQFAKPVRDKSIRPVNAVCARGLAGVLQ